MKNRIMKFTRKLTHKEVIALTQEEDREYCEWHREQQEIKIKKEMENWTFKDYCDYEFTMNNFVAARREECIEEELINEMVEKRLQLRKTERFTFFWETKSPFSQWYKSKFTAPVYWFFSKKMRELLLENGHPEGEIEFSSSEQYMMYCKAMLFMDLEIAKKILEINNVRKIKELGRQVKRFNENTWYVYKWKFVYTGNKYKFTQNKELKEILLATRGTTLVEASPNDKIWGIGLTADNPKAQKRETWEGKNLLGEILTELRIELYNEY